MRMLLFTAKGRLGLLSHYPVASVVQSIKLAIPNVMSAPPVPRGLVPNSAVVESK